MSDRAEDKYHAMIRKLQDDLLAAEMREQFYAKTLQLLSNKIKDNQMSETGMKCDSCGNKSSVIDSRRTKKNNGIYRRRKCDHCGYRWSTLELNYDFLKMLMRQQKDKANGNDA